MAHPTLEEVIGEKSKERSQESEVVDWALPIARQIVDALDAAHEAGIVHRDLKPTMMSAAVRTSPALAFDPPEVLSDLPPGARPGFTIAPDGRFLFLTFADNQPSGASRLRVVFNWTEALRARGLVR